MTKLSMVPAAHLVVDIIVPSQNLLWAIVCISYRFRIGNKTDTYRHSTSVNDIPFKPWKAAIMLLNWQQPPFLGSVPSYLISISKALETAVCTLEPPKCSDQKAVVSHKTFCSGLEVSLWLMDRGDKSLRTSLIYLWVHVRGIRHSLKRR